MHSSSSTATDDKFTAHLWDIQANASSLGIDSRIVSQSGFKVSKTIPTGLDVGDKNESELVETLDLGQGLMNLAAASAEHSFDLFLTYTCNSRRIQALDTSTSGKNPRNGNHFYRLWIRFRAWIMRM